MINLVTYYSMTKAILIRKKVPLDVTLFPLPVFPYGYLILDYVDCAPGLEDGDPIPSLTYD